MIVYVLSSLIQKKINNKKNTGKKIRSRWKSAQNRYSVMQIMTAKKLLH